jgi:hypothetical protein
MAFSWPLKLMIVLYCADAPKLFTQSSGARQQVRRRSRSRQGKGYAENKLGSEYTVQLVEVESGASIILTIFNQAEEAGSSTWFATARQSNQFLRYCQRNNLQ